MKRELQERGTHIPFIIRFPGGMNGRTTNEELISALDFAPTVLSLAGIKILVHMQGRAFLGEQKSKSLRKYVYAARDRMDIQYDRVRMVRDKRYRYLYNYIPGKPYCQNLEYRLSVAMMKEILKLKEDGKLDSIQMSWFKTKPVEELYDVETDPHELHNLADDPKYKNKLVELRRAFQNWTKQVGDMGGIPEKEMIKQMWNSKDEPPATAMPEVIKTTGGVKISCSTKGASIGYRMEREGEKKQEDYHMVTSWDASIVMAGRIKNGQQMPAAPVWQVYNDETIKLAKGDTLYVNALRIGYKPAIIKYIDGQKISNNQVKSTVGAH